MRKKNNLTPRSSQIIETYFSGEFSPDIDIESFRNGIKAYYTAAAAQYKTTCADDAFSEEVTIEETKIDGIPVRIYRPKAEGLLPCVLYFTGSGFVNSDPDWQERNCIDLTKNTGFITINIQERTPPDHPFPAGLNDSFSVLQWLAANGEKIGVLSKNINLCGFSSGGNFVAVLARWARDHQINIDHQIIIAGFLDLAGIGKNASHQNFLEGCGLSQKVLEWFVEMYVPKNVSLTDPNVSPAHYAEDFSGIAPATVIVGEFDPFHDECKSYADKLAAAGIEVKFFSMSKKIHEFASCFRFFLTAKEEDPILIAAKRLNPAYQAERKKSIELNF